MVELLIRPYLDPKSRSNSGPKPTKLAQKATRLHTFGVQVDLMGLFEALLAGCSYAQKAIVLHTFEVKVRPGVHDRGAMTLRVLGCSVASFVPMILPIKPQEYFYQRSLNSLVYLGPQYHNAQQLSPRVARFPSFSLLHVPASTKTWNHSKSLGLQVYK